MKNKKITVQGAEIVLYRNEKRTDKKHHQALF